MFRKKIFTKIIAFFLCFVIVFCDLYNPSEAQAYEGVRDDPSACNMPDQPDQVRDKNPCYTVNFDTTKNYCEVGDFKFSAFVPVIDAEMLSRCGTEERFECLPLSINARSPRAR